MKARFYSILNATIYTKFDVLTAYIPYIGKH